MSLHPSDGMLASLSEENRRLRYQEELSLCLLLCAHKSTNNRERERKHFCYTPLYACHSYNTFMKMHFELTICRLLFLSSAFSVQQLHPMDSTIFFLKNKNKTKWWLLDKLNQKVVAFKLSWNFIRYDNWKLKSSAISVFHQGAVEMKRSTLNLPPPPKKRSVKKWKREKQFQFGNTTKNQKDITIKSE